MLIFIITLIGCGGSGSGGGDSGISTNSGGDVGNVIDGSGISNETGGSSESGGSGNNDGGSSPPVTGSATLSWDVPVSNSDGSGLTDLGGYKLYYGTSSGNYIYSVDVGNIAGAVVNNLSSGTWCFAVTAYDTSGNESSYSNEVCKSI